MTRCSWLLLLTLAACETVEEDLPGKLVQVTVTTEGDSCTPRRFTGDAGVQFFGVREDGGVLFTISQQAQFGPMRTDGGALANVTRQSIPGSHVESWVAATGDCLGDFTNWNVVDAGVLSLEQVWPGLAKCPLGPEWLPDAGCESRRLFTLTELRDCPLRCLQITNATAEVQCSC